MKIILSIFLCLSTLSANATFVFEPSDYCVRAYHHILQLKLDEAELYLKKEIQVNPDNLFPVFLANYIDFFKIYISEDKNTYTRGIKKQKKRLQLLEHGNNQSPWFLYTQASLMLQWSILQFKFGEYLKAFRTINRAYRLFDKNKDLFTGFIPNRMNLALLHTVIGAIPDEYNWGIAILGWQGSVSKGIEALESILDYKENFFFYPECRIYYVLLQLHLGNRADIAWKTVNQADFKLNNNLLHSFIKAHVAMYTGHNHEAEIILQKAPDSKAFIPFHFLDYMHGLSLIRQLDSGATFYFKRFIHEFHGLNYIKESWQKLGWIAILKQDTVRYRHYMYQCLSSGASEVEADQAAQLEAEQKLIPNIRLLEARLLFDGAYYQQALDTLKLIRQQDTVTLKNKIEYAYRMGRIYQNLEKTRKAVYWFLKSIIKGQNQAWYFAASAALQSGLIFEKEMNFNQAREFYLLCLSMHEKEYKSSLDAQAKAGINRINDYH